MRNIFTFIKKKKNKRKGVHSKNASVGCHGYKKPYKGQGR